MRWLLALGALPAQDTLRPRTLAPVVVTAERGSSSLGSSAAAVTRLSAAELSRMPRATLADLLRRAPGFSVVDFDGLGFDPQLMVRGFYGGGEAEYVVVQVDGKPVNQLQTGVVAWDVLPPLAAIEAIEIVRGGVSSLYGDAAIGGVINVITRSQRAMQGARIRWEASGGSHGSWRGGADLSAKPGALAVGLDRTDGFRSHSERTAARGVASVPLTESRAGRLGLSLHSHWRDYDEPGPLLASLLAQQRSGSDPLFRFDHSRDQGAGMALDGARGLGAHTELSGTAGGELRSVDAIRTLPLAPGFGDTKERRATSHRAALSLQLASSDAPIPATDRVIFGVEASRGTLDSRYYRFTSSTPNEPAGGQAGRGPIDTQGGSTRTAGAFYAQFTGHPFDALRIYLGGRLDVLHDSFEPVVPAGQVETTTHKAFSPKAGLNVRYLSGGNGSGNLYFAVSRSFKAPTLDQLYDQRNIPVPFPPFEIQTSNPELRPQHGTSVEAGLFQAALLSDAARATASLSAYQMDMKDELDFDVTTFRYVNLGRSRHRGLEAGATLDASRGSGFASYTFQAATSRSGGNAGKRLKAIPRHSLTAGVSVRPRNFLSLGTVVIHAREIFLDDANTARLPNYTRMDAQLGVQVRGLSLLLEVRNLLDAKYSSSGFLDPAGTGEAYFYPAAGRVIELGVRSWP